ncbi:MAG: aspartate/glutamate racemase family protein, partial [Woeseiaceae bacterium]|nr:aspartate/glutamate racemase family protein [Woeseiaceae bacterium]
VDAVPEGAGRVGLMATPAGVAAGTYQEAFADTSVDVEILAADELDALMTLVNAIKAGDQSEGIAAAMAALGERLVERGAEVLIAGCTEIPLVLGSANTPAPLISSTDELARRTIDIASGQRPLP